MIASPCIQRCAIDETGRFCTGCLRTLEEIVDWPTMNDADKLEVLTRVARRRGKRGAAVNECPDECAP